MFSYDEDLFLSAEKNINEAENKLNLIMLPLENVSSSFPVGYRYISDIKSINEDIKKVLKSVKYYWLHN